MSLVHLWKLISGILKPVGTTEIAVGTVNGDTAGPATLTLRSSPDQDGTITIGPLEIHEDHEGLAHVHVTNAHVLIGSVEILSDSGFLGVGVTPLQALHVFNAAVPMRLDRDTGTGNSNAAVVSTFGAQTSQSDTASNYGPIFAFVARRSSGASLDTYGRIGCLRDGANNSGRFRLETLNAGSLGERFGVNRLGEIAVNTTKVIGNNRVFFPATFTVATVPTASSNTGGLIYVSNGAAGAPVLAFSDGTNWLRCDTLAAISSS